MGVTPQVTSSQVSLLPELLLQDVSVLIETTVDAVHLPAFTHPQLLTNQPNQTLIVRHQDNPSLKQMTSPETHLRYVSKPVLYTNKLKSTYLKIVESFSQGLNSLHVQVVRRLIQDVEVGTEGWKDDDNIISIIHIITTTSTFSYHGMVICAKATRLFCPPDRLATGRVASSPVTP